MSKLNIDQKTIKDLFTAKRTDFLIPDYQRPYAWTESECNTLWDDIFNFAIPEGNAYNFDSDNEEYFLGPIVTFKNDNKLEVIDGQQRLTTFMLLLRAFYDDFASMKDPQSIKVREDIAKCIWKTDEFGNPNYDSLKIDSEVATDNDKEEFLDILRTGQAPEKQKSKYAVNFRFFKDKIKDFKDKYPSYILYLPTRIMNNCILLPIEAESQDTALRIFSTLNDRGRPLADSDIFKAQFYKYYSKKGKKDWFIKQWKHLEELTEIIFNPLTGTPMDELFTRYMYYERAKLGVKTSTTEALRKFYEKDQYKLLNNDDTLNNLSVLATFWKYVYEQNDDFFSESVLKKLFILNYAPNGMWNYFVSTYYMHNKDDQGNLDNENFDKFLSKIIAFIWTQAIVNPGVMALRTPVFTEMINIVNNKEVTFDGYKFNVDVTKSMIDNFSFYNPRPITKSMLTWWMYQDKTQELLPLTEALEIEHIYAKNRHEKEDLLNNPENIEKLGNKSLLEKRINIRASDYRFEDKVRCYKGYVNKRGIFKEGTKIKDLLSLSNKENFIEKDLIDRNSDIINSFINYVSDNDLFN